MLKPTANCFDSKMEQVLLYLNKITRKLYLQKRAGLWVAIKLKRGAHVPLTGVVVEPSFLCRQVFNLSSKKHPYMAKKHLCFYNDVLARNLIMLYLFEDTFKNTL